MLLYVWKKQNNDLVFRFKIDFFPFERVGDINSYGWVLQSIQFVYNNRFYDFSYKEKIRKKFTKREKKMKKILKFVKENWLDLLLFCLMISLMAMLIITRGV